MITTFKKYKDMFSHGTIKEAKNICDYCGEIMDNDIDSKSVVVFWHYANDFVFHSKCAKEFSLNILKDSMNSNEYTKELEKIEFENDLNGL